MGAQGADRLQARPGDGVLQLRGDPVELAGGRLHLGEVGGRRPVEGVGAQLVANQDQLADQVHQPVEQPYVDPQGGLERTPATVPGRRRRARVRERLRESRPARGDGTLQCVEAAAVRDVDRMVLAARLDLVEHLADPVAETEQRPHDRGSRLQPVIAQLAEDALTGVRQPFEAR